MQSFLNGASGKSTGLSGASEEGLGAPPRTCQRARSRPPEGAFGPLWTPPGSAIDLPDGPLKLVGQHRRAYLLLNVVFYGLVALGTVYSLANPLLQRELTQAIVQGFQAPPLSFAKDAYASGNVPAAALVTFLVNTLLGSLTSITIPSLLIPFAGIAIGIYRALFWGLALAPTSPELARAMLPHSLTLILEGQGYVLAMFGAYLLWASAIAGARRGLSGFLRGYRSGLSANITIYLGVVIVLGVAAVYEAFEVIYLVAR